MLSSIGSSVNNVLIPLEVKEEAYDRFMTMEDIVEVSEDSDSVKASTQKPGRDSGIFSTRYSGFFQEGTPLTGSRASDLDHSRYSDLNSSLQVTSHMEPYVFQRH